MPLIMMKKTIKVSLLAACALTVLTVNAEPNRTPEDIVKEFATNAEKAIALPYSRSVVLFDKDSDDVAVVTDNPRWVVKGQLYDMFQNKQMNSGKQVLEAAKKIPLNKLKIDTVNVLSFTYNPSKEKQLDVFIDPFSPTAANDINVIAFASKEYRVRFILTPLKQESFEKLMKFACNVYKESSVALIRRIETKQYGEKEQLCHQDLVNRSYGLGAFVGVTKSPTLIATNDIASFGMPKSIIAYLIKNME